MSISSGVGNGNPLLNFESGLGLSCPSVLGEGRCLTYFTCPYKIPNQTKFKEGFISTHDSKVQSRMCRKVQRQDLARAGFIISAIKKGKEMKPSVPLSPFQATHDPSPANGPSHI